MTGIVFTLVGYKLSSFKPVFLDYLHNIGPGPERFLRVQRLFCTTNDSYLISDKLDKTARAISKLETHVPGYSTNVSTYQINSSWIEMDWNLGPRLCHQLWNYHFRAVVHLGENIQRWNADIRRMTATFTDENIQTNPEVMQAVVGTDYYLNVNECVTHIYHHLYMMQYHFHQLHTIAIEMQGHAWLFKQYFHLRANGVSLQYLTALPIDLGLPIS